MSKKLTKTEHQQAQRALDVLKHLNFCPKVIEGLQIFLNGTVRMEA